MISMHNINFACYHNLHIVPDMPSELSAEVNGSFESITVKWEPPLNENGILLGYEVLYQGEQVYPIHACRQLLLLFNLCILFIVCHADLWKDFCTKRWTFCS